MHYWILFSLFIASTLCAKPIAPPEFDTPQKRLFFFVCDGNIEGIDAALADGADINAVEKNSYPLLHLSIFQENHEVFNHLLEKGADIHAFSNFGNCNALSLATIYDRREMVMKLLNAGADPNAAEVENYMKEYSAIAYAALYGHVDLLKLFAKRGGDLEKPLRWPMWRELPAEFPLLSVAAQHGGLEVVRYLVEERGHAVNPSGKIPVLPPLSVAVRYNNMKVAKYLISKGADVNAVGFDYYKKSSPKNFVSSFLTPLGVAGRYGRDEMVQLLFSHGAKIREKIKDHENPVYLADWGGYYRVIEEFEKHGYTSGYWSVIEREFKAVRKRNEKVVSFLGASEYTPRFLEGHSRQWAVADEVDLNAPLRLAIIADDPSIEVADLLTVALSGKTHLELIERSALDKVLREQKLSRTGLTDGKNLSLVSGLLDAQALVLIETLTVKKKQVYQLRLVNSILGLQFGRHFIENTLEALDISVERYAGTIGGLTNNFHRNYERAIPISLVNVRSDLGTAEGMKIENTLKQHLELQFLGQPSVILTQREDLETLIREKDLGGREEEFKASSLFVDVGVEFDLAAKKAVRYTARIEPATGESFTLSLSADGKPLSEVAASLCQRVMERIDAGYSETTPLALGALSKDAKTYFRDAMWCFNVGDYESCITRMRTAVSLGFNERVMWDHYYRAIELLVEAHREHRGNDANNRYVLALERERLVALEGVLKLYRSDISNKKLRHWAFSSNDAFRRQDLEGFVKTLVRFRPVAMQRRYAKELKSIELHFLRLIEDYVVPSYTEPKKHGKLPLINSNKAFSRELFQAVDLMAQLDESRYASVLNLMMDAMRQRNYPSKRGASSSLPYWIEPPVAVSRWNSASHKYLSESKTFFPALNRLRVSYFKRFNYRKAPVVPISIVSRQEIVKQIQRAVKSINSADSNAAVDTWFRRLVYETSFDVSSHNLDPREGIIPQTFESLWNYRGFNFEIWQIKYAVARKKPHMLGRYLSRLQSNRMALEAFQDAVDEGHAAYLRSSQIEERISEYKKAIAYFEGVPTVEARSLELNKLPIHLWSPQKNVFPEFIVGSHLLNAPVAAEDGWWVIAVVNQGSGTRLENPRYALLCINPETLDTIVRWLPQASVQKILNPRIPYRAVAIAGRWLAIAVPEQEITLVHLDTLEVKQFPGYVPSFSRMGEVGQSLGVYEKCFFFFVQPDKGLEAKRWRAPNIQILMRYNPETEVAEVVYNTRRNPPQNLLDGTGGVFNRKDYYRGYKHATSGAFILLPDKGRGKYYLVNCESFEIRTISSKEVQVIEQMPSRELGWSVAIGDTNWSEPFPFPRQKGKLSKKHVSLVLGTKEYNNQGVYTKLMVKAILPEPVKDDPNYSLYLERIQRITQHARKYHFDKGHRWFGEHYGYINYGRDVLGIFKISDLAEALEESPEL